MMGQDAAEWSFLHFFHMDKANAAVHCAPVRFSPITFLLLYEMMASGVDINPLTQPYVDEVNGHVGTYAVDQGR